MNKTRLILAVVTALALTIGVAACGDSNKSDSSSSSEPTEKTDSGGSSTADNAKDAQVVDVTAGEYYFKPSTTSVKAGKVTFDVDNVGAMVHEMVVYKLAAGEKPDGLKMDGAKAVENESQNMGEVESDELGPGKKGSVTVDLKPGNYILLCNVAGHYKKGMFKAFTVS